MAQEMVGAGPEQVNALLDKIGLTKKDSAGFRVR